MWLVQKQWDLKPISVSLSVIKQVGVDLYSLQVIDGYCHVVKVSLSKKVKLHLSKTSQVQQYPNFYTRLFNWFDWKSRQMAWSQGLSREIQKKCITHDSNCVKSIQILSFFWFVFSCMQTEYGNLRSKSPYSVQIQENTDQKKLRIWTLFKIQILQDSNYKSSFINKVNKKSLSAESQFWM